MPSIKSNSRLSKQTRTALRPTHEWQFTAIGTQWWIGFYQPVSSTKLERLKHRIARRVEVFDHTYSRFRADSLVTRVSRSAGTYQFPTDCLPMFALYQRLYEYTDGLVTPLIGKLLSDAGYDASYSLDPRELTPPPPWEGSLTIEGSKLTTQQPLLLDVGAAGKGYLVDIICDLLLQENITQFCIDAGGDMRCSGLLEPLSIGLEHSEHPGQVIGIAKLQGGALCGSASNRRAWGAYHHIMNPATLAPINDIRAVWVTADTALLADGLATALFFVPPAQLLPHFRFAHIIVYSDNSVQRSSNFPAILYT